MGDSTIGEDDKLKDYILDNLRKNGFLQEYKINLTKQITQILNNDITDDTKKFHNKNKYKLLQSFLNTNEGILCLHLIKDTLEILGLYDTILIFDKEIGEFSNLYQQNKSQTDIQKLIDTIKLNLIKINNNNLSDNQNDSVRNTISSLLNNKIDDNCIKNSLNNQSISSSASAASSSSSSLTSSSQILHQLTSSYDHNDNNDSVYHQNNKIPLLLQIIKELIKLESTFAIKENTNSTFNET